MEARQHNVATTRMEEKHKECNRDFEWVSRQTAMCSDEGSPVVMPRERRVSASSEEAQKGKSGGERKSIKTKKWWEWPVSRADATEDFVHMAFAGP